MSSRRKLIFVSLVAALLIQVASCSPDDPPAPTQPNIPPPQTGLKSINLGSSPSTIAADGITSAAIIARCFIGNSPAQAGLPVVFKTDNGDFSFDGFDPIVEDGVTRLATVNTSPDGTAVIYLISETIPGIANVQATFADEVAASTVVTFIRTDSEVGSIELKVTPNSGKSPLTSSAEATILSKKDEPLQGVLVRFKINDGSASFDKKRVKTDFDGTASTFVRGISQDAVLTAISSGLTASELITITNDNVNSITLSVLNTVGGIANTDPVLLNLQGQLVLQAKVEGVSGPVSGAPVTFSSTDPNTLFSGNPILTNSNGDAEVFANNIRGDSTIKAQSQGVSDTINVKINRKPVARIQLIAGTSVAGQVNSLTFSAESSYDPDQPYGDSIKTYTWAFQITTATDAKVVESNTSNPQLITYTVGEAGGNLPAAGDKLSVFLTVVDSLDLQSTAVVEIEFLP